MTNKEVYTEVEMEIICVRNQIKHEQKLMVLGKDHPQYSISNKRVTELRASMLKLKKLRLKIKEILEKESIDGKV